MALLELTGQPYSGLSLADIDAAVAALRARGVAFDASERTDEARVMRDRARHGARHRLVPRREPATSPPCSKEG